MYHTYGTEKTLRQPREGGKEERRQSEEVIEDPTWGRVQTDLQESVWKALGIICKAPSP